MRRLRVRAGGALLVALVMATLLSACGGSTSPGGYFADAFLIRASARGLFL